MTLLKEPNLSGFSVANFALFERPVISLLSICKLAKWQKECKEWKVA